VTDTAGRLLAMLPLLTARATWRGDELAARLGVTTRTVRQDIGRLTELGYPVRAVPGPQGGYALSAGTRSPPLLDDAAVAVALGLRAAAADPGLCDMEPAAAIEQVMPSRLRRRVAALTSTTVPLASAGPIAKPNVLALIAMACQQGERLRFSYLDGAGERSRRHAEPYRPTRPTPPGAGRAPAPDRPPPSCDH
jgi:predicted DNA-binding transcriptional regulator YafY